MRRWFIISIRFAILLAILFGLFPSVITGYRVSILICTGFALAIFVWLSERSRKLKENEFNRELRRELEIGKREQIDELFKERESLKEAYEKAYQEMETATSRRNKLLHERRQELETMEAYHTERKRAFDEGFLRGRQWLAHYIVEADKVFDESIISNMRSKSRPALRAANEVAEARLEKREYKEKAKFLEYQLKSYKEYFPFLEEYEEAILDETISLSIDRQNRESLEDADPVTKYLQKNEFEQLPPGKRNQLALDRYLRRNHSELEIGRMYERFLGFEYERDGWSVEYKGIIDGYEDFGRDLICTKGGQIEIVQAKCWKSAKLIYEKHIFQLFGTTQHFAISSKQPELFSESVKAVFVTTTSLSDEARRVAKWLNVQVKERYQLDKTYPMIKCNINQATKEKIYHLPFDQQYDRTKIIPAVGEFYARTVAEAENRGFRRAFRHVKF
ncbi:MAG: restriction endonuclease [Terracidiphilus sp.]